MEDRRITQVDIARQAKVHRATVSMALKNHPSIPIRTRDKIHRIAERLGYRPDPMLSALAEYRTRHRPAVYHGTLAWLASSETGYEWRTNAHFSEYLEGAKRRAIRHGYKVEVFDLNEPRTTPNRMASILQARNIAGILLCPQPRPGTNLAFPWADFSAVTFGYTLNHPHLHTVTATQYRGMTQTLKELRRQGYRRIGLVLDADHDLRTDHNYLAGYLVDREQARDPQPLAPLYATYGSVESVDQWLRKYRPDAIVTCDHRFLEVLRRLNVRVPEDVGLACPALPDARSSIAGVTENTRHIGEVAVDFLIAMLNRGERGVPEVAQRIHVEGVWRKGETLKA